MFIEVIKTIVWLLALAVFIAVIVFSLKTYFCGKENLPVWSKKLSENPLPNRRDQQLSVTMLSPVNGKMRFDHLISFMIVLSENKANPMVYKIVTKKQFKSLMFFYKQTWRIFVAIILVFVAMHLLHMNS